MGQELLRAKIASAFDGFQEEFQGSELAILSLTSKPEGLLRDRFALTLAKVLDKHKVYVAREWLGPREGTKRGMAADIALVGEEKLGSEPRWASAIIEFKSMYAFDPLKVASCSSPQAPDCSFKGRKTTTCKFEFRHLVEKDMLKWESMGTKGTLVYSFLSATDPGKGREVDPYRSLLKYARGIESTQRRLGGDAESMGDKCVKMVGKWFPRSRHLRIQGGEYLERNVNLDCWLIGPSSGQSHGR